VSTIYFTTCAVVAYCKIKSSTAAALSSFVRHVEFTIRSNPSTKSGLCVNSSQDFADYA
jgi:hypothetical protein